MYLNRTNRLIAGACFIRKELRRKEEPAPLISVLPKQVSPKAITNIWRKIGQEDFLLWRTAYDTPNLKGPRIAH